MIVNLNQLLKYSLISPIFQKNNDDDKKRNDEFKLPDIKSGNYNLDKKLCASFLIF